jgi:SAM-dependent methyltransferase
MTDPAALLRDLRRELAALEDDLRRRTDEPGALGDELRREHAEALGRGRTAATYSEWRDEQVTQAAVAWLLGCVFVRYCEDNGLVSPVWLAGPEDRRAEARDAHAAYFHQHPEHNDRDWLLEVFSYLEHLPATKAIFDREHNPLWRIEPSADAAGRLVAFWRRAGEDGRLVHEFAVPDWDTRFLGDLYQDLSETARKRYALLQTPEFVEEFILDRTLDRAIEERGVEGLKLIDPACGSGHFLLGAFKRLLAQWHRVAPAMDTRERVQHALDSIHGVDLNPFAVAIARFRLTVAALRASGLTRLEQAPAFWYHLAVGDSLLHGSDQLTIEGLDLQLHEDVALSGFTYVTEDLDALREILRPGQYDVVVANPPYITVKDKALNEAYRQRYKSCHRQYALSVPFCERLFQLARRGARDGQDVGWVGQITANSFMKREFGRKLIAQFLPTVDLQEVIDTSGAYIPGHGTPTVILIGENQPPQAGFVRMVMGRQGEPSIPADPAKGLVWRSIAETIDIADGSTSFITVTNFPRQRLSRHPWSLTGGGASSLQGAIEAKRHESLSDTITEIGRTTHTGADDVYYLPSHAAATYQLEPDTIPLVRGEDVRDYRVSPSLSTLFPYDRQGRPRDWVTNEARHRAWLMRRLLGSRVDYEQTLTERGLRWFDHSMFFPSRFRLPLSITFAFVATNNHFVLDRGGKVFNRSAPIIKLPEDSNEDDHVRLVGLLNSSTACFWLKQVSHNKGRPGAEQAGADEPWEHRYEFTGTKLEELPLPESYPVDLSKRLDSLAQRLTMETPWAVVASSIPTQELLAEARREWESIRGEMVALQEELDWEVYSLYGLLDEGLAVSSDSVPRIKPGERAFEVVLARAMDSGEVETTWFKHHNHKFTPITELPIHWPPAYRELVERRIALIEERPDLALIERPECKRRWAIKPWEEQEKEALRDWVLDRLEEPSLWSDPQGRPQPQSVSQLADRVRRDPDLLSVLELLVGRPDYQLTAELARLLADQAVPFLAAYRYTESGLRKRAEWEQVWALQRREDAGEQVGPIPVPPRYKPADFTRTSYWQQRGKLDVPKERFVAYPGAERDTDPAAVCGWAGWDHLEQARALATLVLHRSQQDGWPGDRLRPLLAGIAELEPWLHQWYHDPDPEYGGSPADYLSAFLDQQLGEVGCTRQELARWQPEAVRRGRGRRRSASGAEERS